MSEKITFSECELIINQSEIPQINIFENKQSDSYELDGVYYQVDCEIIKNNIFWIYAKYGKPKPYTDEVLNIETQENYKNSRSPNEAELKNQFFCIYIYDKATLYVSDFRKNSFLKDYLKAKYNKEFDIKKYFIDPKEFVNTISSVESIKFTSGDKDLFNGSIFDDIGDVYGLGQPINFTLEAKIQNKLFEHEKLINFLNRFKSKKENCEISRVICIGKDDEGFEKIFNLETLMKKIQVNVEKDKNGMYDAEYVKQSLLEQLNV